MGLVGSTLKITLLGIGLHHMYEIKSYISETIPSSDSLIMQFLELLDSITKVLLDFLQCFPW